MKTFLGLFFYVLVGGVIATVMNNSYYESCNEGFKTEVTAYITFGWPAIAPMVVLNTVDTEEIGLCDSND